MTDAEFDALADGTLAALERALDAAALDADVLTKGDGLLELEFADGSKMVINRHTAAREIWVAAKAGAFTSAILRRAGAIRVTAASCSRHCRGW